MVHAYIGDVPLSRKVYPLLSGPETLPLISAISIMEIARKHDAGKLKMGAAEFPPEAPATTTVSPGRSPVREMRFSAVEYAHGKVANSAAVSAQLIARAFSLRTVVKSANPPSHSEPK